MEKSVRMPALLSFLCLLSLLLGVLAIAISCAGARTPPALPDQDGNALAVSGTPEDAGEQAPPEPDDTSPPPADDLPEQAPADPTDGEPSPHEPTRKEEGAAMYTVRLLPPSTPLQGICALGIYDSLGALVEQHALVPVSLTPSDRLSLQAGIAAPDLESARQLVTDFCE